MYWVIFLRPGNAVSPRPFGICGRVSFSKILFQGRVCLEIDQWHLERPSTCPLEMLWTLRHLWWAMDSEWTRWAGIQGWSCQISLSTKTTKEDASLSPRTCSYTVSLPVFRNTSSFPWKERTAVILNCPCLVTCNYVHSIMKWYQPKNIHRLHLF